MSTAHLDDVDIEYEVVGDGGPWVILVQGGRHPFGEMELTATAVAACGFRVLVHDRRNCGRSSIDLDHTDPEETVWVADLRRLVDHLGIESAIVLGRSRGVRIAVRFCLAHPTRVSALFLWGISAGRVALRFLDEYYFGKYLRACRSGGMEAVCGLGHFAGLCAARPDNRLRLLSVPPDRFVEVMNLRREGFLVGSDWPVMGLADDDLSRITVPTAVAPYHDALHPGWAAEHAVRTIPGAVAIEFDAARMDETRDENVMARRFCEFAAEVGRSTG